MPGQCGRRAFGLFGPDGIFGRMTSMTDLKPVEELTFEEALEELEELTSSMASGEATLKESVARHGASEALQARARGGTQDN